MKLAFVLLPIFVLSGCSNQAAYQKELKQEMAKSAKLEKMANTPGLLEGDGCQINLVGTNSQNINGPLLPELKADALHATIKFQNGSLNVLLNNVDATLNSRGKPTYRLVADLVMANQNEQIARAEGHVYLHSLRGKTLSITANQLVWNRRLHQIVATGNVFVVYMDSAGRQHTLNGPTAKFNTVTGEVSY